MIASALTPPWPLQKVVQLVTIGAEYQQYPPTKAPQHEATHGLHVQDALSHVCAPLHPAPVVQLWIAFGAHSPAFLMQAPHEQLVLSQVCFPPQPSAVMQLCVALAAHIPRFPAALVQVPQLPLMHVCAPGHPSAATQACVAPALQQVYGPVPDPAQAVPEPHRPLLGAQL